VGAVKGIRRAGKEDAAVAGDINIVPEASSGKDENVCCCCVSLLAIIRLV
jgi:hypothetical protein